MSDFDPGPGWREVTAEEVPDVDEPYLLLFFNGKPRRWVREVPVPPLPTAPYTVILTKGKRGFGDWVMIWYGEQWHQTANGTAISATELLTLIGSFEVLSEPRAVTAKAVLDLVNERVAAMSEVEREELARGFGVES